MKNTSSTSIQGGSDSSLQSFEKKKIHSGKGDILCRLSRWTKSYAQSTYFYRLIREINLHRRQEKKATKAKKTRSQRKIFTLQDPKKIQKFKIFYFSFQSLFLVLQTITSIVNAIAVAIRVFCPSLSEAANHISEVMNPIVAFISIKNLIVYTPKLIFQIQNLLHVRRLQQAVRTGDYTEKTAIELYDFFKKISHHSPKLSKNLPKSEQEAIEFIHKNAQEVIDLLGKEVKIKLTKTTFKLLSSLVGLLQVLLVTVAPPASIAMTVLYWLFVLIGYVVRPIANKVLT